MRKHDKLFMLLISFILILGCSAADTPKAGGIRVILDTDANNELDDQHAIAYLLLNREIFDVEGITVNRTRKGGEIARHVAEAKRVVQLCDLDSDIRVIPGANGTFSEIRGKLKESEFDGFEAVNFIIERAKAGGTRELVLLPVGKLTNVALALAKSPEIASKIRIVWLGSNYPDPGEYNQIDDEPALNYILDTDVKFEIVLVRSRKDSGTAAVRVTPEQIKRHMAGQGPAVFPPIPGRHGGEFTCFGDYSINLFENAVLSGNPPSRALFDMAAVAIVKNPFWASSVNISAPILIYPGGKKRGQWHDRPENKRKITIWENFNKDMIIKDFFETMKNH
jgi:inosine-uridine nucleoside N-ribohydrolase